MKTKPISSPASPNELPNWSTVPRNVCAFASACPPYKAVREEVALFSLWTDPTEPSIVTPYLDKALVELNTLLETKSTALLKSIPLAVAKSIETFVNRAIAFSLSV